MCLILHHALVIACICTLYICRSCPLNRWLPYDKRRGHILDIKEIENRHTYTRLEFGTRWSNRARYLYAYPCASGLGFCVPWMWMISPLPIFSHVDWVRYRMCPPLLRLFDIRYASFVSVAKSQRCYYI